MDKYEFSFKINSDDDVYSFYHFNSINQILLADITLLNELSNIMADEEYDAWFDKITEKLEYDDYTDDLMQKSSEMVTIKSINKGSIELIIAGLSLFASILIPYHLRYLQKRDELKKYSFEFNTNDKELTSFIRRVEKNEFGKPDELIDWILSILQKKGYNVIHVSEKQYRIEKIENLIFKTKYVTA
jgi:mRNA-degrading endonuclease HigB of HigAB toxin-antitoxin module